MISIKKESYLDYASAAPVLPLAWRAFLKASKEQGNPSSPHGAGVRAKSVLEDARLAIARLAGVKRENVTVPVAACALRRGKLKSAPKLSASAPLEVANRDMDNVCSAIA